MGKNVEYFIFWAKSVNLRKYGDQFAKIPFFAETTEFSSY